MYGVLRQKKRWYISVLMTDRIGGHTICIGPLKKNTRQKLLSSVLEECSCLPIYTGVYWMKDMQ